MDDITAQFYSKNADHEDYLANYVKSHSPRCKWTVDRFKLNQLRDQRILGIGEGVGMNFQYLDTSNHMVGMDGALIPPASKLCSFLNLRVDFDRPDFGMLYENDQPFDWIIAAEVIEHVSFINNLMKQMKRLLKPNGYAIFTIPDESVTHPTSMPGLFFPADRFAEYIQQWAFIIEDFDIYQDGWKTCAFKVRNAPQQEARPRYFKGEAKFINSQPDAWPNL